MNKMRYGVTTILTAVVSLPEGRKKNGKNLKMHTYQAPLKDTLWKQENIWIKVVQGEADDYLNV